MSDGGMRGRVAVVTGASAGIGRAIASRLASEGVRVVLNARRAERLEALASELNERVGARVAVASPGDAAEWGVVRGMLDVAAEAFGAEADLVVVNAGRGLRGSVFDSDETQWEEMIRTNLLGAARLMREAAHRMAGVVEGQDWRERAQDIVVIGSNVGRHISPFSSMYGSTKFAVNALAESLRREMSGRGVRVTLIEPGFVASEFQGVAGYDRAWFESMVDRFGPVLTPEDVARTVSFVCAQPAHVHACDVLLRPTRQEYP